MTVKFLAYFIGMGVVTYIPRLCPLLLLSRRCVPDWLVEWLDFIPVAILCALILPSLITTGEPRQLVFTRPDLLVAIPTFVYAWKTRSLAATVVLGMALYWLAGVIM